MLPHHIVMNHPTEIKLRNNLHDHCMSAYVEYNDTKLYFSVCLTCKKGIVETTFGKNESRWFTMHSKNDVCKQNCTKNIELFVRTCKDLNNTSYQNGIIVPEPTKYKKKTIPAPLRNMVWDGNIGRSVGESVCLCCEKTVILQRDFHCGHIVAEVEGGKTEYENLLPICKVCNISMGKKNMCEFKKDCGFGDLVYPKSLDI
jgi:hypothetical protein